MNKLKKLRKEKELTQAELAKFLGISQNNYSYWENSKVKIDNQSLQKLAAFFNVTIDYILGQADFRNGEKNQKGISIPVYGEIAAGIPIEAIEDIVDYEEVNAEFAASGQYIALKIKGDSMAPEIRNGDVVLVRLQPNIETDEIGAVYINGHNATLKKIKKESKGIWLVPLNSAYKPEFFSEKECADLPIKILGKMVEVRRKY